MPTRERLLDAAAHVLHTHGLARATTKEIARQAGYSEAALYKHFEGKSDLFLAVLHERVRGDLVPLLAALPDRVGHGRLRATLVEVATAAIAFYGQSFPMAASLFSEPALLAAHRDAVTRRDSGPERANAMLADYLRAEKQHGRVRPDSDPDAAAGALLGACMQRAFLRHFAGGAADEDADADFAAGLADALLGGVAGS